MDAHNLYAQTQTLPRYGQLSARCVNWGNDHKSAKGKLREQASRRTQYTEMLSMPHTEPLKHMTGWDALTLSRLDAVPGALAQTVKCGVASSWLNSYESAVLLLRRPGTGPTSRQWLRENGLLGPIDMRSEEISSRKWKKGLNRASRSGVLRLVSVAPTRICAVQTIRMPWRRGNVLLNPELSYIMTLSNRQIGI